MSFPNYALFYFPDSDLVKVDSTDIILREHRQAECQVSSREQVISEEGYIVVRQTDRGQNGQTNVLAAKILLLGDVHDDLLNKRDAFNRGEDIWKTTAEKGKKTPEAIKSASTSQSAADAAMGDKLKRELQNLQGQKAPVTSTPMSDDSDNTDIDLFENTVQRQSRKGAALESDNEQEDHVRKRFENSLLQRTSPHNPVTLDDVVKALKELPGIVSSLKDVLESMKRGSYSSSSSSSELSLAESSEMISLADSDVKVSKRKYDRLNKSRVSLFTQELATLIFGKEKLATSTLTGKSGPQTSKDQLDPHKVTVLIDTVKKEFPKTTMSEVRAFIQRKCNNESTSKKSQSAQEG